MIKGIKKLIGAGLLLALWNLPTYAAPTLDVWYRQPEQVGTSSSVRVALEVYGSTWWYELSVGGGFTISCPNVGVEINAEAAQSNFGVPPVNWTTYVPGPGPRDYDLGLFYRDGIQVDECRTCTFFWRGRAIDASAGISASGRGASFSFNVGGDETTRADTVTFRMCRYGGTADPCNRR